MPPRHAAAGAKPVPPGPKPPRTTTARDALRRLLHINTRLSIGRRVTAVSLAAELEVHARTIKRDIATLRHEHGAQIEWEPGTATYICTKPSEQLPLLRLSADEALALQLAGRTFAAWGGSPLGRALVTAFGKIGKVVGNAVTVPADSLGNCITQPELSGEATQRWFGLLLEAIGHHQVLRLTYCKPGAQAGQRQIRPLHLAFLEHEWMLIAHDETRGALRHFLLTRIEALERTRQQFVPPSDFAPKDYLASAFGRHVGGPLQEVCVRFDAQAAPYLREKRWHHSQTLQELPDGGVAVRLCVSHLLDVQRWVLSWGSHAEAMAPEALREAVAQEVALLAPRYKLSPSIPPTPGHALSTP